MLLDAFLKAVRDWAESQPDVLGIAVVGSHARGQARPDSDVDLVVLCKDPAALVARGDWALQFGRVREVLPERYASVHALRVFYNSGLEVEFGCGPLTWADVPLDAGTRRVISNGMRIVYDPAGTLRNAQRAAAASPS